MKRAIDNEQYNTSHTSNADALSPAFDGGCVRTRLHVRQQLDRGHGGQARVLGNLRPVAMMPYMSTIISWAIRFHVGAGDCSQ